ncbi:MAG: demethylmenaquinone methyltransferase [Actinomycetaceae bacterium]|nr:demethylmenaquinone methyltransferase [Actinomycetaceae bacterium]
MSGMNRRATLAKNPMDVSGMFDDVASGYDMTNDVMTAGQMRIWREAASAAVGAAPGVKVLDLAAGTATSTAAYVARGAQAVACDFSLGMLSQARRRNPGIACIAGDATQLPFADATFDVVTISYGLRNISDPVAALRQMLRVTKPGGRLVVAEVSTPTWAPFRRVYRFYVGSVLPVISRLTSSDDNAYGYLAESILNWPDQLALAEMIQEAGWRSVGYRNLSGGIVALHRATRPMS